MAFLTHIFLKELLKETVKEAVKVAVVATAVGTATYATYTTVDSLGSSASSSSTSSGFYLEQRTIFDWWCNGISSMDRQILLEKGYSDYGGCFSLEELDRTLDNHYFTKAPGKPGKEHGFEPDKNWDGKTLKKEPNGQRRGYLHKDGSVWVPNDKGHGGANWEVQQPNGDHHHVYPDGRVRRHWNEVICFYYFPIDTSFQFLLR